MMRLSERGPKTAVTKSASAWGMVAWRSNHPVRRTHTTGRGTCESSDGIERRPAIEGMLCAMALESANGRQKHHTQAGLHVCCERALKSASERTTHGGAGSVRGPSGNRPRERSNTSGNRGEALHGIDGGDLAARLYALQANC
jgi:hypothetical protein